MAILGLGLDICAVERIRKILEGPRGARFLDRVFTVDEQRLCGERVDAASAYAARFAAKEALTKALGAPPGLRWLDMEVVRSGGAPHFKVSGVAREQMEVRNLEALLALTHDAGVAAATVVIQERPS